MNIVCNNCGEPIPAANINIQEMVAVCPACGSVFRFDLDEEKPKHRKMKPPARLLVHEDAPLHLSYQHVFGVEARGGMTGIGFAVVMFAIVLMTMIGGTLAGDIPFPIPLIASISWLGLLYTMAMIYWTKHHLISDGHQLRVLHEFSPHPMQERDVTIPLTEIESVYVEESQVSKLNGAAERSYNIYASTYDGTLHLILKDMPENYARYIQQEIDRQIRFGSDEVSARLSDDLHADDEQFIAEPPQVAQSNQKP